MKLEEWEKTIPEAVRQEPLWKMEAYRLACLLYDLAWQDCEKLAQDFRGKEIARQLIRSAGSVSANIEEGFGRGFGAQYAYHLTVALGSCRESKGWYLRARELFSPDVLIHRMGLADQIIGLLVTAIRQQRKGKNHDK